jgi:manganese/zinc/iron transport system permease protein
LAVIILAINLVTIALFFNGWKLTTFDPAFAKTLGFSPGLFNYLLMILVSLTVVGAFRAVGVLMVLTFITAPPLTARLFCYRLSTLLVWAAFIALVASFVGVALSRHLLTVHGIALSTGGVVVTLLGTIYLLGILLGIKDLREAKAFEKNSMNAE